MTRKRVNLFGVFMLLTLRFQAKAGQLDNGGKITTTRKDIARCLTVLNERKSK